MTKRMSVLFRPLFLAFCCCWAIPSIFPPAYASNGPLVRIAEASWTVSLRSKEHLHGCGAALIASRWLLTAGHCLTWVDGRTPLREQLSAWGGNSDLRRLRPLPPIRQAYFPPGFFYKSLRFFEVSHDDIALIELDEPVTLSEGSLTIISLPTLGAHAPKSDESADVFFSGWGQTPGKKADRNEDGVGFELRGFSAPLRNLTSSQNSPELHSLYSRKGVCLGDSGSPLVLVAKNESPVLSAVASKVSGSCSKRSLKESVFTKIEPFLPWIESVMNRAVESSR